MALKNDWTTGDVFRATDANAIANAVNGHYARVFVTVGTAVTLGSNPNTDYVAFINSTGVPSMPTAIGNTNRYTVKNISAVAKTLACSVALQTIDGTASISIAPGDSVDLYSDQTTWRVV